MHITSKKESVLNFIKYIDKKTLFIAAITTLAVLYYANPLINIELTEWNRTFCLAAIDGISIDKRVKNFYLLFIVVVPFTFSMLTVAYSFLFRARDKYKDGYLKICVLLMFTVVASYISRFAEGSSEVNENVLLQAVIPFLIIMAIIALVDFEQSFNFHNVTVFFVAYMIAVLSSNILFQVEIEVSIVIIAFLLVSYAVIICKTTFGKKIFDNTQNFILFFMWTPVIVRLALEGLYFLNEKGYKISRYYTNIFKTVLLFGTISFIVILIFRKKEKIFTVFGYTGAIASMGAISYFSYAYQYVWSYSNYANLYEIGNSAVAYDSIVYGKIPIVDYFSAHAISDVLTKIIYCVMHSDIKGIFIDPYGGLTTILGLFCLFYIIKTLFDEDISILFVCLFPYSISGIKVISFCFIAIAMLLYIIKNPKIKSYLFFWVSVLFGALFTYDEGISLGLACIFAYLLLLWLQKKWKDIGKFILGGAAIGGGYLLRILCIAV